jgi:hypothetical protein
MPALKRGAAQMPPPFVSLRVLEYQNEQRRSDAKELLSSL